LFFKTLSRISGHNGSDRTDALVGLPINKFGVDKRSLLKDEDLEEIFNFQCNYFRQPKSNWHPYFHTFVSLFEGLNVKGQSVSFSSGDVCFVDSIKCPTSKAWMGFVITADGKKVWDNCQRIKNRFLDHQIDLHQPKVVLFYRTAGLVKAEKRGQKVLESDTFSNELKLTLRYFYDNRAVKRYSKYFRISWFMQQTTILFSTVSGTKDVYSLNNVFFNSKIKLEADSIYLGGSRDY